VTDDRAVAGPETGLNRRPNASLTGVLPRPVVAGKHPPIVGRDRPVGLVNLSRSLELPAARDYSSGDDDPTAGGTLADRDR